MYESLHRKVCLGNARFLTMIVTYKNVIGKIESGILSAAAAADRCLDQQLSD